LLQLTLRIVFSLAVVLFIMWGLARVVRRPLGTGRRAGLVSVLGRQQLSKGAAVAVVRVVDRALVVGVTDGQVTLLGEADLAAVEEYQPDPVVRREAVPLDELSTLAALPALAARPAPLAGSLLAPGTWTQAWQALRGRAS